MRAQIKTHNDPCLPLKEAAVYLGLSWRYVYRLCKYLKEIPYVQASPTGRIRIRLSDLNRYVEKHRHGRTA